MGRWLHFHKTTLTGQHYLFTSTIIFTSFYGHKMELKCDFHNQSLDPDRKIRKATKTPTTVTNPKDTVGRGPVSPIFCKRPLPVVTSMVIAAAKLSIAIRPNHISKLLPPSELCSQRTPTETPLHSCFLGRVACKMKI